MQSNSIDRQVCHMKRWQQRSKLIAFWNFHVGSLHLTFLRWANKFQINTITRYYWKATDNASQYSTSTSLGSSLLYHKVATTVKFYGISISWDTVFIPISANLHSQKSNLLGGERNKFPILLHLMATFTVNTRETGFNSLTFI